jgi:hypothetical protein
VRTLLLPLYMTLQYLLNILVQIANIAGNEKKMFGVNILPPFSHSNPAKGRLHEKKG